MSTIKVNRIENTASSSGGINIDASGRVGVDSTPEAWSGFSALEVNEASIVSSGSGDAFFTANAYYDGAWKYKDAGVARNIYMNADGIVFRVAASGSADAAITWSEAMRINTDSSIKLGSGCPGIDFSDIQTNNAGMTSETLDSYEEGSWTPTITFGGGSTGLTYNRQHGTYTKIGNIVYVKGHVSISAKGSSTGHADIRGLPFTPNGNGTAGNPSAFTPIADRGTVNAGSGYIGIALFLTSDVANGARFYRYKFNGAGNAAVDHSNFTTNSEIDVNFVYKIN